METPVVLFLFRRPETTREVFQAIREAKPKTIFLIADGPRDSVQNEKELSDATREVVSNIDWPCTVHRAYSDINLGLRERILTGLDFVFSNVEKAIILEDDCLPNESFFVFCEQLLDEYSETQQVSLISGFNFAPTQNAKYDYFFSKSTYIWGWATWARTWSNFRASAQVESWSEGELDEIRSTFASRIQAREFLGMAREGKNLNTWDISLAVWIRQGNSLTVIPNRNMIRNIGFGAEATHTKFEAFDVEAPVSNLDGQIRHPDSISLDPRKEKLAWRKKSFRWLTFPIQHPIDFLRRVLAFLEIKNRF